MYATTVPDSAPLLPVESLCPQEETHGVCVCVCVCVRACVRACVHVLPLYMHVCFCTLVFELHLCIVAFASCSAVT